MSLPLVDSTEASQVPVDDDGVEDLAFLNSPSAHQYENPPPINQLPYDVLREIFQHLCSEDPEEYILPPTRLGAVCKTWRQVAWAAPSLWTELELTETFWGSAQRMQVLDLFFQNLGGMLLTITISDPPTPSISPEIPSMEHFPARDVFERLFRHNGSKLRSITFHSYIPSWVQELGDYSCEWPVDIQKTPRLMSIYLGNFPNPFSCPWTQLIELSLHDVGAGFAIHGVTQCVNLQYLNISDLVPDLDEPSGLPERVAPRPTHLVHLRSFIFDCEFEKLPDSWDEYLTNCLVLHALVDLNFAVPPSYFRNYEQMLGRHLSTVSHSLTRLYLHANRDLKFLQAIRNSFPSLTSLLCLSLRFSSYASASPEVLYFLTADPRSPSVVLPSLMEFSLAVDALDEESLGSLLSMVRSRRKELPVDESTASLKFRKISLRVCAPFSGIQCFKWPEGFVAGIRAMINGGLDFEFQVFTQVFGLEEPWQDDGA